MDFISPESPFSREDGDLQNRYIDDEAKLVEIEGLGRLLFYISCCADKDGDEASRADTGRVGPRNGLVATPG
jgi:hypothetical protein